MKTLGIIFVLILALAALVVGIDWLSTHTSTTRVRAVRVGDTKHQVEQILGRPVTTFTPLPEARTNFVAALLSVRAETWAYGSRLELRRPFQAEFPYFLPVRLRLFQPDADDVSIEFDSSGRVSKIVTP
jgi:outer membrane protein assembly factor BamE (lipoprotein component of BamABCDE complex)